MDDLTPTKEQQLIISNALEGENLVIRAFAGAAKTSTCIMVAKELNRPSLYVAFNKSIADEAKGKFPKWVDCRTMHSLAYRKVITNGFKKKLQSFFQIKDISFKDKLSLPNEISKFDVKNTIISVIKSFCQSGSEDIEEFSFLMLEALGVDYIPTKIIINYWNQLINDKHPSKITHDVYLKIFQLSRPNLNSKIIYLDEAQDSNEVVLSIVMNQINFKSQVIFVGDSYQAIYEWRGAINALDKVSGQFKQLYLTESFRFNQQIATLAQKVISLLGNDKKIIGRGKSMSIRTKAVIVRNNSTLLEVLQEAHKQNKKVHVLANLAPLWSKLYHIQALYFKSPPKFPDKELLQYTTFKELEIAAEYITELQKLINLGKLMANGDGLSKNIAKIKTVIVKDSIADFVLTTCHKSKGLEWDEVTINSDLFQKPENFKGNDLDYLRSNQVGELIYVAITRAKSRVNLPINILDFLNNN